MNQTQLVHILDSLVKQCEDVLEERHNYVSTLTTKEDRSPVTELDKLLDKKISTELNRLFPDYGIVSEEGKKEIKEYTWAIDPLDGTSQYIKNIPQYSIMIGLIKESFPLFGYIYNPVSKDTYWGSSKEGAFWRNNKGTIKELKLTTNERLNEIVISLKNKESKEELLLKKGIKFSKVIQSGSEGLRTMEILKGNANLRIEFREEEFGLWDIVAPHAIALAAGAVIEDTKGETLDYKTNNNYKVYKSFVVADSKERIKQVLTSSAR